MILNRLIKLEILKEHVAEFRVDRLKKNRPVFVYGSLLTYTDQNENGNTQLFYKVRVFKIILYALTFLNTVLILFLLRVLLKA